MDALTALTTRASAVALIDPAPDDAALERMLAAAVAAPDHGRLRPWRFLAVRGAARERLGAVMADALRAREPAAPEVLLEKERQKPLRAPLVLVAAAKLIAGHKIPAIEQIVAVAAAAQNLIVAAHALGYGAMWKTGAPAYDAYVKRALGLEAGDQIVGFLYLGTSATALPAAIRAEPRASLAEWSGPSA
ncbi:MAG: nitroreductase [Alphaproteobacteria bacterium]